MKATWDKLESNWMQFQVEVEADEFSKAVNAAFKKLSRNAKIPGFRPGKAPRVMFENIYGKDGLVQEAVDHLLPQAYNAAVSENSVEPIDQPEVEIVQAEDGKPFIFKGKVQVVPEVTLGKLSGFDIEKGTAEVKPEEVEAELKTLQERTATLVADDTAALQEGSFAVIDFEGFVDDVAFEGGKGENYSLEIGSKTFIPGFEEQLVGAKVGDELEVKVTFPEHYHADNLAGKDAVFKVTVKEVKRKEVSELNDDFAAEVSDFKTLKELREDIKNRLKETAETKAEQDFRNSIIEAVVADASVETPEVMVHNRIHEMLHEFEGKLVQQGLNLEFWMQLTGKTEEDIHQELEDPARQGVKNDLVLAEVAKQEGITVTDADVEAEFDHMLAHYQGQEENINQLRKHPGYRLQVRDALRVQKTVDHLVKLNTPAQDEPLE